MISADAVAAVRLAATSAMPAVIGAAAAPPSLPLSEGMLPPTESEAPRMLKKLCEAAEQVPGRHQDRVAFIQVLNAGIAVKRVFLIGLITNDVSAYCALFYHLPPPTSPPTCFPCTITRLALSSVQLCGLLLEASASELARGGGEGAGTATRQYSNDLSSVTASAAATTTSIDDAQSVVDTSSPAWLRFDSCASTTRHLLALDGFDALSSFYVLQHIPHGSSIFHHPWASAASAFAPSAAAALAAAIRGGPTGSALGVRSAVLSTLAGVLSAVPVWRTSPLAAAQAFLDSAPVSVAGWCKA
jgi:hypothetical protein